MKRPKVKKEEVSNGPILKKLLKWEVVVDQLIEWSLLISQVRRSIPVIGKFNVLSTVLLY